MADKGGPPAWGLSGDLTTQHKSTVCYKKLSMISDLEGILELFEQRRLDMHQEWKQGKCGQNLGRRW
jgi:hypothetical protein